ncbi:LysR family transcriptional regulator [Pseudomonas yamanorum]|uniref:LysR family transcriptional regulator n=1 Tax=Pseudomonas yamanorum TaxID=515393 RepID=UPI0007A46E6B|nr:LysR family transcriptional regulator [Pseudomonas yamanorum]
MMIEINTHTSPANPPLVPLHALWFFEAVARQKSFTKASHVLDVTQSAVSKQVRKLEKSLGLELFERRCTEVTLTQAGTTLLACVQPMLVSLNQTVQALTQEAPLESGGQKCRGIRPCQSHRGPRL